MSFAIIALQNIMNNTSFLKKTEKYVKKAMEKDTGGHDWFHVQRVTALAMYIVKKEKKGDIFLVQLLALLHDIADWKFTDSLQTEEEILDIVMQHLLLPKDLEEIIKQTLPNLSFRSNLGGRKELSIEGKIVQDADRLDALGAIGIARAFAYGGKKERQLYNPENKPKKFQSINEYKHSNGSTINHFYEKLFHLKDLMNTKTAKNIAVKREKFMRQFVKEFLLEWDEKTNTS